MLLGRELTTNATVPVGSTAYAEINAGAITADHCAIGSNASMAVNTTKTVDYDLSKAPNRVHSPCQRSAGGGDVIGSDHERSISYHKHRENSKDRR